MTRTKFKDKKQKIAYCPYTHDHLHQWNYDNITGHYICNACDLTSTHPI